MATWTRIEDPDVWQAARELTRQVYQASGRGGFAKDFALRDQIGRSSVSIMSNIAEGFERGGTREFVHFLSVAKGSNGELRSQLYVAEGQGYLGDEQLRDLMSDAERIGRMLGGLMKYLRTSGRMGPRFRGSDRPDDAKTPDHER